MVYRVIGCMSGSSMDGLDMAYCVLSEVGGIWSYEIEAAESVPFTAEWKERLSGITEISAKKLMLTDADFGHYIGQQIQGFIDRNKLEHKVHFVASHGHTVFHEPASKLTFQMGNGAAIASELELPVITNLRNMDVAFGGQGAPIVPIAEKMLWAGYEYFLNIGGIANLAHHTDETVSAFDICPANRILNVLAGELGLEYDDKGSLAQKGKWHPDLLQNLNSEAYYKLAAPKSLSNEYGLDVILPIVNSMDISIEDKLATFVEHIAFQIGNSVSEKGKLLVSGGGAHNNYLLQRIEFYLNPKEVTIEKPDTQTIDFKEAISMALIGALRWREEENVLAQVSGAQKNSIGGALWMGRN